MMDLDSAIQHCEEVAISKTKQVENGDWEKGSSTERDCIACADEHRQLAEWLKELKAYRSRSEIPNTCGDAISREAVLNAMYELCDTGETLKENPWRDNPHIDGVVEAIEELPPVTPQSKTGHWIDIMVGDMPAQACDQCNTFYPLAYTGGGHKYCPNCGCKMEVEE